MDQETRIRQFKQMSEADPENELGHFSLGKAYLDAGRFQEAIAPLQRAIDLNERMSKAYQLLGEAYQNAGQHEESVSVLRKGLKVAEESGDRVPMQAMAALLEQMGVEVDRPQAPGEPQVQVAEEASGASGGFHCARCGRPGSQLTKPPFKGPLGEKVFAYTCQNCWREWVAMGTKVINELGLQLADPKAQNVYDEYMAEFLQLQELP